MEERPIRVRIDPPVEEPPRGPGRPTAKAVIAVVVLFGVTFVVAQSCQQSQVRLTQRSRPWGSVRPQAGFTPEAARRSDSCVRGSMDAPTGRSRSRSPAEPGDGYGAADTVRVDANTGKVAAVKQGQRR